MSNKAVTFYSDAQTSMILGRLPKGRASRYINEAIAFYHVHGEAEKRSTILDFHQFYSFLCNKSTGTYLETELLALLGRFMKNSPSRPVVQAPLDFSPPSPRVPSSSIEEKLAEQKRKEEEEYWKNMNADMEEYLNAEVVE